jgi:hypothetical protein
VIVRRVNLIECYVNAWFARRSSSSLYPPPNPEENGIIETYSGGIRMTTILSKLGIAALIGLGSISAMISTASASPYVRTVHEVRYDRHHGRVCSPAQAVRKARAHGLHNAHVAEIAPRRVIVDGRSRFGRDRIVFANVPGCPIIRR